MKIQRLATTDGFIAVDLDKSVQAGDAPAVGMVRSARKILQGGAKELARSLTYTFAVLEQKGSGASAGINAADDERPDAIAAFVKEIQPMVSSGRFLPTAGTRVQPEDLATLRPLDSRSALHLAEVDGSVFTDYLIGVGAAAAAAAVSDGSLIGKKVAIEGFGPTSLALAAHLDEMGAAITAISTSAGLVSNESGFDVVALGDTWRDAGPKMIEAIGEVEPARKVFGAPVDVLFTGSKMGALTHQGAEHIQAATVVPTGPIPVTTKAFAALRRSLITVVPDFVSTAGPIFAMWPADGDNATVEKVESTVIDTITNLMGELNQHDDGPLLAACYQAESFLSTWQDKLPFGRPLA